MNERTFVVLTRNRWNHVYIYLVPATSPEHAKQRLGSDFPHYLDTEGEHISGVLDVDNLPRGLEEPTYVGCPEFGLNRLPGISR